jgi:multidrug transporter EmrE-like cation transporter
MEKYLFIGATLGLTLFGQVMMKWRALAHAPSAAGGRVAYLIAMYTDVGVWSCYAAAFGASVAWSLAIQRTALTIAYPFMALTFVLVPLAGVFLFRESLSMLQLVGVSLIVVGVALSAAAG